MKKLIAVCLAVIMLLAFAACKKDPKPTPGPDATSAPENKEETFTDLLDRCVALVGNYSEERLRETMPEGMLSKQIEMNNERGRDFMELIRAQFEEQAAEYAETYGEDWKISYTLNQADEKDAAGIENYKSFDSHYFSEYGIDTSKIEAVTFARVTMHIEGSRDSADKDKTIQCFKIDGKWYSFYAVMMGLRL